MAIGQGDVLVSPLQVASTTAAIANGGDLNQPFLLRTIKLSDGEAHETTPKSSKINIKEGHLEVVRSGMRAAVTEGSAKSLSEMPIALAGKTGTAQIGGSEETHAWFTSFGPYEDPKIVVTVLVEKGGDGDKVAVPMAEKIWRWLYDHDRI
jgi:cell division protein FtsI/penicillin-binding protein 2